MGRRPDKERNMFQAYTRSHHRWSSVFFPRPSAIGAAILTLGLLVIGLAPGFPLSNIIMTPPKPSRVRFDLPREVPDEVVLGLDAILVLGGGVPKSMDEPPVFTQQRCNDAAEIVKRHQSLGKSDKKLPILCLSAGTAHLPQFLSADGLPVWESTSSAAYLMTQFPNLIDPSQLYAETTSYDTISNAFYARASFTDISGWRNLLVITNEFHMDRSQAIFDWIFGLDNKRGNPYQLYYLAPPNTGLTEEAVKARKEREAKSQKTVETILAPKYQDMKGVWTFLTQEHSFYTAHKLVERGRAPAEGINESNKALKESYGLKK